MSNNRATIKAQVRLMLGEDIAIGPGKVQLLAAIARTGSISAAAREMGMSYRRAWLLVDTMNGCFDAPLVTTSTGGKAGGGATITPQGQAVLESYESMQREVLALATRHMDELLAKVRLREEQNED